MPRLLARWLVVVATLAPVGVVAQTLCPDGKYVDRGPCQLCPDGSYVGGGRGCQLTPGQKSVPERRGGPQLAPDGTNVPGGGPVLLCPDGSYVSGRSCVLGPDGRYTGGR